MNLPTNVIRLITESFHEGYHTAVVCVEADENPGLIKLAKFRAFTPPHCTISLLALLPCTRTLLKPQSDIGWLSLR